MSESKLTYEQKKAAELLAAGFSNIDAAKKCGVSESTIIRWKRLKGFQAAVEGFRTKAAAEQFEKLLAGSSEDVIQKSRNLEEEQLAQLDELIKKVASLAIEIIDSCSAEDISPRALPGLLKANVALVECRRTGADRILGMDAILDELSEAEKIFSEKIGDS